MDTPELENAIHPRLDAEIKNHIFMDQLADYQLAMEFWELRVAHAKTPEEAESLRVQAMTELDGNWEYHGSTILVSGTWWKPQIMIDMEQRAEDEGSVLREADAIAWQFTEDDVFAAVTSIGFAWRPVNGKDRLGYCFDLGNVEINKTFMRITFRGMGVALPEAVSLEHIPLPTQEQAETHKERVIEVVELYDKLFELCFNRPEFYELSHNRQKQMIDRLLQSANDNITAPGTGIYIGLNVPKVYQRTETSTGYGYRKITVDDPENETFELHGSIMGVTILDQDIVQNRAIRSPQELVDATAGLCLLIDSQVGDETRTFCVPAKTMKEQAENLYIYADSAV